MTNYVLHAFDPGGTTGYARCLVHREFDYDKGDYAAGSQWAISVQVTHAFNTREDGKSMLDYFTSTKFSDYLGRTPKDVKHLVLVEVFRLFDSHKDRLVYNEMPAAVMRGWVECIAALYDMQVVQQNPADMKPFANAVELRSRAGLDSLPSTEHERDAIRHCLYWFHKNKADGSL